MILFHGVGTNGRHMSLILGRQRRQRRLRRLLPELRAGGGAGGVRRLPVLLTQPGADRWTPLHRSEPFLGRITKVPVETVTLENAGHYPLEQPGLDQLVDAVESLCQRVATASS